MHSLETIIALNNKAQNIYDTKQKREAELKRLRAENRILKRQLAESGTIDSGRSSR